MSHYRQSVVVVGVDGSTAGLCALEQACEEARVRGGEVEAVTVWHDPPGATSEGLAYRAGHRWAVRTQARSVLRALDRVRLPAPLLSGVVVEGDPADVLARAGQGAACIVLGRHGASDPADPRGSTLERCVAVASCPVVVAAPNCADSSTAYPTRLRARLVTAGDGAS